MIIAGLHRHDEKHYIDDQLRDVGLITAAVTVVKTNQEELDQDFDHDLTADEWSSPNAHRYLSSEIILDRITANHDTALEALKIIIDEQLLTEAALLHRLDGHHRALISGAL